MQTTDIPATERGTDQVNNDKTLAILAHLGGIVLGFIPSLIIYLMKKDAVVNKNARAARKYFMIEFLVIENMGFDSESEGSPRTTHHFATHDFTTHNFYFQLPPFSPTNQCSLFLNSTLKVVSVP